MTCPQRPWAARLPGGPASPPARSFLRALAWWAVLTALATLAAPAMSLDTHAQTAKAQANTTKTKTEVGTPPATAADLDPRVQQIKSEALDLGRDWLVFEEEDLFPAATQLALFLSMNVDPGFTLRSVQVQLDGRLVVDQRYTPRELQALQRGGVQPLYRGALKNGRHELAAWLVGQDPQGRDYQRRLTAPFNKAAGTGYLELRVADPRGKGQPEFDLKLWQRP